MQKHLQISSWLNSMAEHNHAKSTFLLNFTSKKKKKKGEIIFYKKKMKPIISAIKIFCIETFLPPILPLTLCQMNLLITVMSKFT